MNRLNDIIKERVLILDGAMGTVISNTGLRRMISAASASPLWKES